jgi:hypothetical protein
MESPLRVTWLQRCAALAAWLWVASGAGALPTFMPIDVPTPRVGAVWGCGPASVRSRVRVDAGHLQKLRMPGPHHL